MENRMKYIALLRGINVGKTKRIDMKQLKSIFETIGYTSVSTYINSGNIIFESSRKLTIIHDEIKSMLFDSYGYPVSLIVKTSEDLQNIVNEIPLNWINDQSERTDVAFLFAEIDSYEIIDELPLRKEFIDVRYVKGAIFWNVKRENYNKSHLNKLISHRFYQYMTIRNINTARYLAGQ